MPLSLIVEFVLLAALWGLSFLFMRLGAAEFGALPTAGLRVGLATFFLLPVFLLKGVWADFAQHYRPVLLVGLLNSGIPFALLAFAVMHITTGLASILNATVPLAGALVAWLWLKDRPSSSRILGLLIGFAGVTLLVIGGSGFSVADEANAGSTTVNLLAMGACLVAALCYGLAGSFTKRYLTGLHPLATATGSQIGATLGLTLPTLWLWPKEPVSMGAWSALAAAALLCSAIAHILFFRIIERAGPSRTLAVNFLTPVFALMYGAWFLDERITPWMVLCGVVIVFGTILSTGLMRQHWLVKRAP